MSLASPTYPEILRLSERFGFTLEALGRDEVTGVIDAMMDSYRRLDALPNPYREVSVARKLGTPPTVEDNPHNAWSWRCAVKSGSDGILRGRTIALKDNICLAGMPLMNGSRVLEGFIPREDATVVTRIVDAGGEITGKGVCENFCFSGGSHTSFPLPVLNPRNDGYMAGGSSSGCAALVASGAVDMAIGGDQGGSIRIPASWSGIVGLKPTHGLVPYTGVFAIEGTLDHIGPMAQSVSDTALLLQAIAGVDGLDPRQANVVERDYIEAAGQDCRGLKIGILKEGFEWTGISDPEVGKLVKRVANALKDYGATVKSLSVPEHVDGVHVWSGIATEGATAQMVLGNGAGWNWKGHYTLDMIDFYHRARLVNGVDFPLTVQLTAVLGSYLAERYGGHYYGKSQNLARRLGVAYDRALTEFDALILPTTPMVAMKYERDQTLPEYMKSALGMLHNTCPFNFTGHPAISVPCGTVRGLPVGLMAVGRLFEETTIIRIASAIEHFAS